MYGNKEIAKVFKVTGQLMDLYDENPFKVKSYQAAAFKIERVENQLAELGTKELEQIEGIGKSHASKIREIVETGTLQDLQKLLDKTPPGIIQMLNIKGIGPKKAKTIWQELKIDSIGELLYACNENRLVEVKGFGYKIQEQIQKAIHFTIFNAGKFHFATAEKMALLLMEQIKIAAKPAHISLTGAIRRKSEVIEKIEILVGTDDIDAIHRLFPVKQVVPELMETEERDTEDSKEIFTVEKATPGIISGKTKSGILFEIVICQPENFFWKLFISTGSSEHVAALNKQYLLNVKSEEEIYAANNLEYVIPEMREKASVTLSGVDGKGVLKVSDIIEMSDLKGILHVHSLYSDGIHSLEQMATYCNASGYEYLGMSDHSQSAFYANGLKSQRVAEQHAEIDALNKKLAPFKIFKGIESDILSDGSLDYDEAVLETFDFIVASIHSNLKMDKEKATSRLLKAIENPHTTILGHPTGRLILIREGYEIDHKAIIDACAKHHVVIELNANPYRLDMDWRWINYALSKGVMISINPDAHNKESYSDMYYGVCVARKGGLTKDMTFNAMPLREMENYFIKKKSIR